MSPDISQFSQLSCLNCSVRHIKVSIPPKSFLTCNKSFYRSEQDSAKSFFLWFTTLFFANFHFFFHAWPSKAKTRASDVIPGFSDPISVT